MTSTAHKVTTRTREGLEAWPLIVYDLSEDQAQAFRQLGCSIEPILHCRTKCGFTTDDEELLVHHEDTEHER